MTMKTHCADGGPEVEVSLASQKIYFCTLWKIWGEDLELTNYASGDIKRAQDYTKRKHDKETEGTWCGAAVEV